MLARTDRVHVVLAGETYELRSANRGRERARVAGDGVALAGDAERRYGYGRELRGRQRPNVR